ncbi:YadA-like family protein [Pseudostreptobacillus hongkongensis]|uniref:YadA-like family protein n=1 Tax=Pseudostreptobacillus hongkongensis TaxID=1162717 RepID=UPI0008363CB9|nr:YadA-like family protein [Pseudostreptobacillus hongkongensis]
MNSKERNFLRKRAHNLEAVVRIRKEGVIMKKIFLVFSMFSLILLAENSKEGDNAIADGIDNVANGNDAVAVGNNNKAVGEKSVSIGIENETNTSNSIAIGKKNKALGSTSIAIGLENKSTGQESIAFGTKNITGEYSISFGYGNINQGNHSVVSGRENNISGEKNYVIGEKNNVKGNSNFVFGSRNIFENATSRDIYIFGSDVKVNNDVTDAIVLGRGSEAVSNALSIGNSISKRRIVNVAEAQNDSDVITLGQAKTLIKNNKNSQPETMANNEVDLSQYLKKDFSNIDEVKAKEKLLNILNKGTISDSDTNFITGKTAYDYISNYTYTKAEIDTKIQNLSNNSGSIDTSNFVKKTDFDNFKNEVLKKSELNKKYILDKLGNKEVSFTDASNIQVDKYVEKLSEGANIQTPKGSFVTDKIVNKYLTENYLNKNIVDGKLDLKADKDAKNINIIEYVKKLSNGSNILNPTGSLVTDTKINEYLTSNYTNNTKLEEKLSQYSKKDGSNIEVDKYVEKLSDSSDLNNPKNRLITDTKLKSYLEDRFSKIGISSLEEKLTKANQESEKAISGVANAIAVGSLTQINTTNNQLFNIGVSYGMYSGEHAFALGISGTEPSGSFVYKVNTSINTKAGFGIGVGGAYQFAIPNVKVNNRNSKIDELNKKIAELENLIKRKIK